jgi:hypothetical protein
MVRGEKGCTTDLAATAREAAMGGNGLPNFACTCGFPPTYLAVDGLRAIADGVSSAAPSRNTGDQCKPGLFSPCMLLPSHS